MKIIDGMGSGRAAGVSEENRLLTEAITTTEVVHESQHMGAAYSMATPNLTVTTTKGAVFWFYNSSTTKSFCIERMIGSFNGDSTNWNRVLEADYCVGMTTPSANNTLGTIRSTNSNFSITAEGTFYYWNETSTGMTVSSNGITVGSIMLKQGVTDLVFGGTLVIGPGVTFGLTAKSPAAAGEFAVIVSGYYKTL